MDTTYFMTMTPYRIRPVDTAGPNVPRKNQPVVAYEITHMHTEYPAFQPAGYLMICSVVFPMARANMLVMVTQMTIDRCKLSEPSRQAIRRFVHRDATALAKHHLSQWHSGRELTHSYLIVPPIFYR